jgi:ABC-2 type transport system permease protein
MSPIALAWTQFRLERKLFWRNPSAAFFSFILPLMLLFLTATVFNADHKELQTLIPGIAGMSVMATTFNALAFNLTVLRDQGVLKRIRGTPIPTASYFAGFLGNAVANAFVQTGIVVVIGNVIYGVSWPQDWFELVVFCSVGVIAFGSIGMALAHAIPNPDSAPAYVNAVFLPVIFISGVFYDANSLPKGIEAVANILPLTHVIDGFSSAIVSGEGLSHNADNLAVVGVWAVAGVFLAVRNFRWE